MSDHMKNYLCKSSRRFCRFLFWPLLTLALSGCMGASTRDPLIIGLTPQRDIVVVDGQSVQFTVDVTDAPRIDKFIWLKSLPLQGTEELPGLRTRTVTVPFSLKDNGTSIGVIVSAPDGQTDSAATMPIKVIPK
jgi:hypothetical protein